MARDLCHSCHYPLQTCVCDAISKVSHQTKIIVLQHPSEVKNAKNTVRLLTLMSDNIECIVGETEADFTEVKTRILAQQEHTALLFPAPESIDLQDKTAARFTQLVVLDGTWKKAKKILLLNPWLASLTHVSFAQNLPTQYQIRSSKVAGGLSTIEAVAYALNNIEQSSVSPFLQALEGLKRSFTKNMPADVKARYQQRE